MNAVNDKTHQALLSRFGNDVSLESANPLLSAIIKEIGSENGVPFKLNEESGSDEGVIKYFENSYAYVKFSK